MNARTSDGDPSLKITHVADEKRISREERMDRMREPGFGRVLTEHMVTIRWSATRGWHDGQLQPYAPITLDPAAAGLHYGQIVFEGLKAYSLADGDIGIFRPRDYAQRLRHSANRLAMPEVPEETFIRALDALVQADYEWVPRQDGAGFYLRPVLIATEANLGLRPASEYLFMVMAFVTDTFFPDRLKPLTVWVSEEYTRAAPGGTGAAKCPGNYAASLLAQEQAREYGCDQVVWLDAVERRWVEEMGGMNIFFVLGPPESPSLITPPLTDTILPGVTRDSLLAIARDLGYQASEGHLSTAQWRAASASGTLLEAFACGTAAVVVPIGEVRSASGAWTIGRGEAGPVTLRLRQALVDLQRGAAPDRHGWLHRPVIESSKARHSLTPSRR
jgi:branched-chain amino acid aminotransferase